MAPPVLRTCSRLSWRCRPLVASSCGNYRGYAQSQEDGKITGPKHYPTLANTLRNTRGRELLRIVDAAVPNLNHPKEFIAVLRALALDGQWRRGLRLFKEMRQLGLEPDLFTYNLLLSAMGKDKQVEKALGMLIEMKEQSIIPDIESLNYCVGAVKPSEWQRALDILADIPTSHGLEWDGTSFINALMPCEEGREWQRVITLFHEISQRGLQHTSVGYNYALSACREGKQWKHAYELMGQMEKLGFDPDFRLRKDLEAQSQGLDRAPPPQMPARRSATSPDSVWQRKQQLRELREQEKLRQEERRLEKERQEKEDREKQKREQRASVAQPATDERPTAAGEPVQEETAHKAEEQQEAERAAAARKEEQRLERGRKDEAQRQEAARKEKERQAREKEVERRAAERKKGSGEDVERAKARSDRPKLRSPGSYVLPVFAQHDRSNHAERQALIKIIARVQDASGAQTDAEFEKECAEVTGTVRLYASHTPCISCMACFCQFQRLFPKVKLCVDFDDWRDTRRMVEIARREQEHKKKGTVPPNYDCPGLSDMSDEEDFPTEDEKPSSATAAL